MGGSSLSALRIMTHILILQIIVKNVNKDHPPKPKQLSPFFVLLLEVDAAVLILNQKS